MTHKPNSNHKASYSDI